MPTIRSLSDFTRNQNSFIEELERTKKPIYLTRNGSASVVIMDAAAFDNVMEFRNDLLEQEMRTYANIMRGAQEFAEGKCMPADEANELIRKSKGWA